MFGFFGKKSDSAGKQDSSEEVLLYCPSCGGEYRVGFEKCSTCDVDLVLGAGSAGNESGNYRQERKLVPISSGDELVPVKRSGMVEIKSLQRLLAAGGIDSMVAGANDDCAKGCCRSSVFDLNVRRQDFTAAMEVVDEEFRKSTGLSPDEISDQAEAVYDDRLLHVSCPACGSEFTSSEKTCPHCGLCF